MATMCPPGVSKETCPGISDAELAVYEELRRSLPTDWLVLHSLWLKNHPVKAHAEIDFIVISDRAILLLEVKGGTIWRDHEGWHFQTKTGRHKDTKASGPFDQVRGAYYAIRDHLRDLGRLDLFHDRVWGYGVIMPECILKVSTGDTAIDPTLLLDLARFPEGLPGFLEEITRYWRHKNLEAKANLGKPESELRSVLTPKERDLIRSYVRPVIQAVRGLGVSARESEAQIRKLTLEQYRALNNASGNDRIILLGSAGTGKTVLAVEQAVRMAEERPACRVLFTCFNRLLADHLRRRVESMNHLARPDILNYHQLVTALGRQAGLTESLSEDWEKFNDSLESLVLEAVQRLTNEGRFRPYDYMVMDEAQDLMHPRFFGALEFLIQGGIEHGHWTMCIDPTQTIFTKQFDQDLYDRAMTLAATSTLSINCRNTRQVAAYVTGLTRAGAAVVEGADGEDPVIRYYKDLAGYKRVLQQMVNSVVGSIDQGRIPAGRVAILTTDRAFLPEEIEKPGFFIRPVASASTAANVDDAIQVATVQSFKGLEASCIILVGIRELHSPLSRGLLYVGGSRAKSILMILLPEEASSEVQACIPGILEALAASRASRQPIEL